MTGAIFFNSSQMSNLTILLGYMALLIILGAIISLKTTTPSSFMLGNRSFPGWLLAFSIVGTNISSLAFVAYPAKGYSLDFDVMIAICGADFLALMLAGVFFVRFLRRTPDASIYTLLEQRFGTWASIFASVAFICASLLRMGVIMCLVAKALHTISGSNVGGVIVLCGIIVIFYTYMAGIEGVIWTDLIQTISLIVAGIVCFLFIKTQLPEGITSIVHTLPQIGNPSTTSLSVTSIGIPFIYFLVLNCAYFMTDQAIAQRYIAGKSVRAARGATYIAAIVIPLALGIFFFIGVALYTLFNGAGGISLPAEIAGDADRVFVYFITNFVPDGMKGLMIIGILSAAMSTVDSGINSSATVFISNIYHPHIKRYSGLSGPSMDVLRRVSLLCGAIGILIGYLVFLSGESVLDVLWKWYPTIIVGIFGLFLLMRISNKVGPRSGAIAVVVGVSVSAWISFTSGTDLPFAAPFHYMLNCPIGLISMVTAGLLLSLIFDREKDVSAVVSSEEDAVERPVNTEYHLIKQNALIHALKPNPYYRLLGLGGCVFYALMLLDAFSIALTQEDQGLFIIGGLASFCLAILPHPQKDSQNKKHSILVLALMGVALPLIGAVGFFAHPGELFFNYFFMATIAVLGAFTEWVILGFLVSIAACAATLIVGTLYSQIGIPSNWLALTSGCLGIMTLYAMNAARRSAQERERLEGISMVARSMAISHRNTPVIRRLTAQTADFLENGAPVDTEYSETLSIRECLGEALEMYPFKETVRSHVKLKVESDFNVKANRELLTNCFVHIIDNAAYYLHNGDAETLVCRIDGKTKKIHFEDDGPGVPSNNIPYIFELFFGAGKLSAGLGLTYCRRALKNMDATVHLTSEPNSGVTEFTISF